MTFPTRVRVFLCAALLCATSNAIAQEQEDTARSGPRVNSLVKGAWALQFAITQNFTLGSFNGATISLKKQTSDRRAMALGAELRVQVITDDRYSESQNGNEGRDQNTNLEEIRFLIQRVCIANPSSRTVFFWAIGPTAYFGHYQQTSHYNTQSEPRASSRRIEWAAGGSAVLGAEWFATRNVSLLATYGSYVQYRWSESVEKHRTDGVLTYEARSRIGILEFYPTGVKFGLSVYW